MPYNLMQTIDVNIVMEDFLKRKRPPEEIRSKVDLAYKLKNQSVIIYNL